MILVDEGRSYVGWKRGIWCHLVSDTSLEELHDFARSLCLKQSWFQSGGRFLHYDVTECKAELAVKRGAVRLSSKDLVWRMHHRWGDREVLP